MKKAGKKPTVKKATMKKESLPATEHKVTEPVTEQPIVSTAEEKPKVMLQPEVEGGAAVEEKPAGTTPAVIEVVQEPPPEVKPVTIEPPQKPEMPPGELARSIDTLAKIVDQDGKPGTMPAGEQTNQAEGSKNGKNGSGVLGMILAFIIGLCLGIIVGYVLWGRFVISGVPVASEKEETAKQEETAVPTPKLTPTPTVSLKRTDLKIKVLNGTGGKGVAAAAKEYLTGLGYESVETGNAKRSDYAKTEVVLSKAKATYWDMLKGDLSGKYTLVDGFTTDEELLTASGGVDVLIIIGGL